MHPSPFILINCSRSYTCCSSVSTTNKFENHIHCNTQLQHFNFTNVLHHHKWVAYYRKPTLDIIKTVDRENYMVIVIQNCLSVSGATTLCLYYFIFFLNNNLQRSLIHKVKNMYSGQMRPQGEWEAEYGKSYMKIHFMKLIASALRKAPSALQPYYEDVVGAYTRAQAQVKVSIYLRSFEGKE